ncbi:MAG: hypothetical protein GTO14_13400 [Anaerolineales bacterium]|nr:hypothetical protein [Anaerolineales bacterium]
MSFRGPFAYAQDNLQPEESRTPNCFTPPKGVGVVREPPLHVIIEETPPHTMTSFTSYIVDLGLL